MKMKIITKSILSLLGLVIAFYIFTVFQDFYSSEALVGSYWSCLESHKRHSNGDTARSEASCSHR